MLIDDSRADGKNITKEFAMFKALEIEALYIVTDKFPID
jgi:hypothetical protein